MLFQIDLQSVIRGGPDGAPREEGGVLGVDVAIGNTAAGGLAAIAVVDNARMVGIGEAALVNTLNGGGLVAGIATKQGVVNLERIGGDGLRASLRGDGVEGIC